MTRVPPSTSAFSTLYAEQGDVGRARELYDSMRRPAAGGTRVPPPTSAFCTRARGYEGGTRGRATWTGPGSATRRPAARGKGVASASYNLGVLAMFSY